MQVCPVSLLRFVHITNTYDPFMTVQPLLGVFGQTCLELHMFGITKKKVEYNRRPSQHTYYWRSELLIVHPLEHMIGIWAAFIGLWIIIQTCLVFDGIWFWTIINANKKNIQYFTMLKLLKNTSQQRKNTNASLEKWRRKRTQYPSHQSFGLTGDNTRFIDSSKIMPWSGTFTQLWTITFSER